MILPVMMQKMITFPQVFIFMTFIFSISYIQNCQAFQIQSNTFQYKKHPIAYETANLMEEQKASQQDEPILLLNGFGVGSFHQHRLMPKLITMPEHNGKDNSNREDRLIQTVYGIDYLGQGSSWPANCDDGNSENEQGLIYSIDTWADQILNFIETVILPKHGTDTKIHVIGNSVGGHLAVVLAARRPDWIASICLLNATPVWGLNLKGWSGHLPPPQFPRFLGRVLFDLIRDVSTIDQYLDAAYVNREAFEDTCLVKQIRSCTEGKGGHAAFASILYSPPATYTAKNFYDELSNLKCDVLLLFGKDDPWCTPAFAKRMYQCLEQRKQEEYVGRYIEIDNVGHCPNHEAPTAVGKICQRWIRTDKERRGFKPLIDNENDDFSEKWCRDIQAREVKDSSLSVMEKLITTFI